MRIEGTPIPGWRKLDQRTKAYLRGLLEDGFGATAAEYAHHFMSPESAKQKIPALVSALDALAVTPHSATHPGVRKGLNLVEGFFNAKERS